MKVLHLIWKGIKGFGMFWRNFLIGDAPEIAIGVVIILTITYLLRESHIVVEIILPLAVISLLTISVWRKAR